MNHRVSMILLALVAGLGLQQQQLQFVQANSAFNVGFMGGLESGGNNKQGGGFLTSTFGNTMDLAQGIPSLLNNAVQQVTKPLDGLMGSMMNPVGSTLSGLSGLTGGLTGQIGGGLSVASSGSPLSAGQLGSTSGLGGMGLPTGVVSGLTTGLAAATGLGSVTNAVTAATQPLTNPAKMAGALSAATGALTGAGGALSGAGGALSGASRVAGALAGAAQTAGAVSAASQAAGAMSALGSSPVAAASNLLQSQALNSVAGGNLLAGASAIGAGVQNVQNSLATASAVNQLAGQNSFANPMGAISGLNQINSLAGASHLNQLSNMAQYNHMQNRREALATGLAGSSLGQAALMGGLGGGPAEAAAATLGASAAGTGALGSSGLGLGLGHPLAASGLGLGMREAGAAGAIGDLATGAALGAAEPHLLANSLAASQLPYSGYGINQEAAALQGAGYGLLAANNHLATGALVASQLIPGAAHHPGMAVNQAIARDAIDSTARSLGASRALEAAAAPLASAANGAQLARNSGAIAAETALTEPLIENPLTPARQTLAADAHANTEAEASIAGSDMVAHGLENTQSASLASNAYRQAKLASSRDRVNIAGTIQNSARISDAAIATHDAATKAEDSLLGSELAVDSAATVLDSDAAYIPPVTNSMLRSLPYGRLGLRNIIPKPLNYPSVLLPDVWLNGQPVNYRNLPFRMMPYGIGAEGLAAASVYGLNRPGGAAATGLTGATAAAANPGLFIEGQPILANNGIYLNGLVIDPKYAYLRNGNHAADGSSIMPILANGQLEAQDEVNMANILTAQQQLGPGMLGTYNGFGRLNTVPMLTGSISDANLAPTTTVGTTYPIGSALVVEPRDSYFQDYIDNASSRQNFDERHQ